MTQWYKRSLRFLNHHWIEATTLVAGLILVHLILSVKVHRAFATFRGGPAPDFGKAGEFGDFVGGYFGTLFALIGVVLLIKTFRTERQAAREQEAASRLQAFENKYFELLKMHHDNVAEIGLRDSFGRKVFVLMLREWREGLEIVRSLARDYRQDLTQRQLLAVSYCCFFFGVGPNSSRMLRSSLSNFEAAFINAVEAMLNDDGVKSRVKAQRKFKFTPFEGHQSRLGHYYRHLYQMVRYVDQQQLPIDKYEYIKTIRAQLSTHEQALLLLNSLSYMGQPWWSEGLIVPYRLVQNIPKSFFLDRAELPAESLFPRGYFEWEEGHEYVRLDALEVPYDPNARNS